MAGVGRSGLRSLDARAAAVIRVDAEWMAVEPLDMRSGTEADIKDLFEPDVFAALLNDCYCLDEANKLTAAKLAAADTTTSRLLKQAEAAFKVIPQTIPMFDHFSPASWLIRNPTFTDAKTAAMDATLDRVEKKVFKVYNALL